MEGGLKESELSGRVIIDRLVPGLKLSKHVEKEIYHLQWPAFPAKGKRGRCEERMHIYCTIYRESKSGAWTPSPTLAFSKLERWQKTVNREQLNRKSGERERKRRRKIGAWRPERIYSKSKLLARGNNTTRQLTENISVVWMNFSCSLQMLLTAAIGQVKNNLTEQRTRCGGRMVSCNYRNSCWLGVPNETLSN